MDFYPGELFYKEKKLDTSNAGGAYLFFDTETTGLPRNWNAPVDDVNNWPRLVQLAFEFYKDGSKIRSGEYIIKPDGFVIPTETSNIHGITTFLVAHNMSFDEKIIGAEFLRSKMQNYLVDKKTICTKDISTDFCKIPSLNGKVGYKWPKLSELHKKLFNEDFEDSHNAAADVRATAKCFWELKKQGII